MKSRQEVMDTFLAVWNDYDRLKKEEADRIAKTSAATVERLCECGHAESEHGWAKQ